jgi:hypothetical protein
MPVNPCLHHDRKGVSGHITESIGLAQKFNRIANCIFRGSPTGVVFPEARIRGVPRASST